MDKFITDVIEIVNKEAELKKNGLFSILNVTEPVAHMDIEAFRKLFPDVKPTYTDRYKGESYCFDRLWSVEMGGVTFMALSSSEEN